ncbi:hypothetical protein CYMTET_22407 [Cymbomonas tetramitiformis]|uniref:Uncharacterized protein n=1 Tax=Cymbomonas tetramitiformis TaxID=36881 RepID=A0AAE0G0H2_9CHLO|nr:hypothetical protein CYMTET_22407 [Cymbomonas tetramitiformis]
MLPGFAELTVSTTLRAIIRSHVVPSEPAPAGMHRLGITPNDTDESENYDSDEADEEFDERLAAERTAYASGKASGGFQPGGAYSPAGFHTEWGIPLERTRERFVAGGVSHFPNPPYDDSSPPLLDALADLLTTVVPPPGGEIYELTNENDVTEDEDEAATVDAGADSENFAI